MSAQMMNQVEQAFKTRLNQYNLAIPNDWLSQCIEFVLSEYPNRRVQEYSDLVFKQLLDFDLAEIGVKSLPDNVLRSAKGTLNGRFFLQVNLCLDSTQSSYSKLQKLKGTLNENALVDADAAPTQAQTQYDKRDKKNRMLTLHLTDGESKLKAIEYQPLNRLKEEDLIPGVKIELVGPVMFIDRILYLTDANLRVLGGQVEGLNSTEYLINAIQEELNSRNEKYRQPQDRVENFDTSSNTLPSASSKKPLKNENRFNSYQQSQQQSFDTKPNMTERQQKPAPFTNNRAWNERESSSSNKCQVVKDEDDDDDLLLNIDLQKLEKKAQNPVQPVLTNNINVANRRNDPTSTKIKRMPSEEICFIEKTNTFRETNDYQTSKPSVTNEKKKQRIAPNLEDEDEDDIIELINEEEKLSSVFGISKENQQNKQQMKNRSLSLCDISNESFLNSCCRRNRGNISGVIFNLSTCTHVIKDACFEQFTAPLTQIKLNWYQECLIADESGNGNYAAYISNDLLASMIELTCHEARELFKRASQSSRPNETREYKMFEEKRLACERKFADIVSCTMRLKFDLDRNKFCILALDEIKHD